MSKIYIVIAAKQVQYSDGTVSLVYDDATEKFIQDEDSYPEGEVSPSIQYLNYLQSKCPTGYTVIRAELNVETSVNIQSLLANDAKLKLTDEELNALTQELVSLKK